MDTTQKLTHIGLCAGYGGIELGLKRVLPTMRTVALCEIEAFAVANLVAKMEAGLMDPAPIWSDLKTFPWDSFRDRVDILTGGYPCQPFSAAGQRRGTDDQRHLWPWIADGIRAMRPRVCFFENVEGHITLGLSTVISDLEEMGYRATWGIFSAAEVGAPHQRKRVFIMAVAGSIGSAAGLSGSFTGNERITGIADYCGAQDIWPSRPGEPQHAWEPSRVVANAESSLSGIKAKRQWGESSGGRSEEIVGNAADTGQPQRGCGEVERSKSEQEPQRSNCDYDNAECETQPAVGGNADGVASGLGYAELCVTCDNRTDELRLLGNGVVPATAALAFKTLLQRFL